MKSNHHSHAPAPAAAGLRGQCQRLARFGAVFGAGALLASGLLAGALGCSAAGEAADASELGSVSEGLSESAFKPWFTGLFGSTDLNSDVALCNVRNNLAYFLVAQTTASQYQVRSFGLSANPSWAAAGTRTFNSAPTCTPERFPGTTDPRFLIAGRGSQDGKIYVAQGSQGATPPGSGVPPNPTFTIPFTQLNGTAFTGTNGQPAMATNNSRVVLTYKNGSRLTAHQQSLPYSASGWSGGINSPLFPSGVTVTGVPAITFLSGSINKFVIMVRGTNAGVGGLYWILFTGTAFDGGWSQAFTGGVTVSSDPALEYDRNNNALTLYFRSGNDVLQTSVTQPGEFGIRSYVPIPNLANAVLRGAPRAAWPAGIEGIRTVAIRGFNDNVPSNRNRHVMSAETAGAPDPFEFP